MYMHRPFIFLVTSQLNIIEQVIHLLKSYLAECLDRAYPTCMSVDLGQPTYFITIDLFHCNDCANWYSTWSTRPYRCKCK
jgi:hypothetical protein